MDNLPHLPDREVESEIELSDMPVDAQEQGQALIWLERVWLVWQRHRRGWRLISFLVVGLLGLSLLGGIVSSLVRIPVPSQVGAGSNLPVPTRTPFRPDLYPQSRRPDATYPGHRGFVASVLWSPDSTRFASSGGSDDIVRVQNRVTGQSLIYRGHTSEVTGLAWSPDGRRLASASRDMTVQIWNATTGQSLRLYRATKSVYSVAWSPNGVSLAFGDFTNQVFI